MRILILLPLFLFSQMLYSQTASEPGGNAAESSAEAVELPRGYRSVLLGMGIEEVKETLLTESRFDFRGDPDVSIRKTGTRSLIVSRGRAFIDRGFFQFEQERLYLITLDLNREKMDFYTMQRRLSERYGQPETISPEGMSWSDGEVRLSLEYPLTVKYLDLETFNGFLEERVQRKSFEEISRDKFLEDF